MMVERHLAAHEEDEAY